MLDKFYPLIQLLADGKFHSGETLSKHFSISRTAIWKQIKQLDGTAGINIQAVTGRGYRLESNFDLLQKSLLLEGVDPGSSGCLDMLQILSETASTNDYLRAQPAPSPGRGLACFAEYQSAGRGRRGKTWVSGFGRNIILSLSWSFDIPLSQLSGLSIALGTAVAETLVNLGLNGICLKWPNDLHVAGRKLGGILVEASGELDGPSLAVIGIGVNVSSVLSADIDQPWTALDKEMSELPARNILAGKLLNALVESCKQYSNTGLAPFLHRWDGFDCYRGRQIRLITAAGEVTGCCFGVDQTGGLIIESSGQRKVFHAGEVSLRLQE